VLAVDLHDDGRIVPQAKLQAMEVFPHPAIGRPGGCKSLVQNWHQVMMKQ